MDGSLSEGMAKIARKFTHFIENDLPVIVEAEGLTHFKKSFENEGFTDDNLEKWEPRKTTDKKGQDITRYRSNRIGRIGELNQYGRRNQGRPILTGYSSAGNKLRNSLRAKHNKEYVIFYTHIPYAQRHNEGIKMPKRQFMGESKQLTAKIKDKVKRTLDTILK